MGTKKKPDQTFEQVKWGKNTEPAIRAALDIYNITDKLTEHKSRWKQHIERMDLHRLPKNIDNYNPRGKRDVSQPRKRWS